MATMKVSEHIWTAKGRIWHEQVSFQSQERSALKHTLLYGLSLSMNNNLLNESCCIEAHLKREIQDITSCLQC